MGVKCPTCRNVTSELMSCEGCGRIGCSRCVVKHSRQWLCDGCRKNGPGYSPQSSPSAPSQTGGFPGWFS